MADAPHKGLRPSGWTRRHSFVFFPAFMAALGLADTAPAQDLGRFPRVLAENVNGETVSLPNELSGRFILMVLATDARRQRDVASWYSRLEPIEARNADIVVCEVVVAGRRGALERFLIEKNMRSAARSRSARARTFAVFETADFFRRSLALPSDEDVFVLLMNGSGSVFWREQGRVTQAKLRDLEKNLASLSRGRRVSSIEL